MDRSDLWQEEVDLNSFDRDKQRLAVLRLGMRGGDRAIQLLISVLHNSHKDSVIRAKAVTMLGALKAEKAVVELVHALSIQSGTIQICAVVALGNIGNKTPLVTEALLTLRESSHNDLRKAVEQSLAKLCVEAPIEVPLIHVTN